MSGPARRRRPALPLARGLSALIALGCFAAIAWSARERSPAPLPSPAAAVAARPTAAPVRPALTPAEADACRARKQAEIAAVEARGPVGAEQRMRIRQIEARSCE